MNLHPITQALDQVDQQRIARVAVLTAKWEKK